MVKVEPIAAKIWSLTRRASARVDLVEGGGNAVFRVRHLLDQVGKAVLAGDAPVHLFAQSAAAEAIFEQHPGHLDRGDPWKAPSFFADGNAEGRLAAAKLAVSEFFDPGVLQRRTIGENRFSGEGPA
jgi:hypothetical protein